MDIDLLKKYFENPYLLLIKPDISLLKELVSTYPWVQSFQLMYCVAINQTEGILSGNVIEKASAYSTERINLYKYLTKGFVQEAGYELPEVATQKFELKAAPKRIFSSKNDKTSVDDIINNFILKTPSIQRPKADFFDPVEKANKSISEEEEFVSETLAKIYIKQQKFEKAIRIYSKLSLLFPEKSSYFAPLIDSLNKKINQ